METQRKRWIVGGLMMVICLGMAAAQFRELGSPDLSAQLTLTIDPQMPARVYLHRWSGRSWTPFRLAPVDALLPIKHDYFYRERFFFRRNPPETLELTSKDKSHFFLLKGKGTFELPPGKYRVEAYRGMFFVPAAEEFEVKPGEQKTLSLKLVNWAGAERDEWISCDPHVHILRSGEDDEILLDWLEADDLNVISNLHIQRQSEAAVQFGFGPKAEARRGRYGIRSGEESRSEFFGHISLQGIHELLKPVSLGLMYANSPLTYPYPAVRFDQTRAVSGMPGYAHFNGSMRHTTLLECLALGKIDFTEVMSFGYLNVDGWYELLNAGLRFTGIAGSDFPVQLGRTENWPGYIPLLGPERTLVKARIEGSPYEAWAAGVAKGGSEVIVTNGPLVDLKVDEKTRTATASARFFRPLESLEIVLNGQVLNTMVGDGQKTALTASAQLPAKQSFWIAARVKAQKGPAGEPADVIQAREESAKKSPPYHLPVSSLQGEPVIQAHTNPVYVLVKGKPAFLPEARAAVAKRWEQEIEYYRTAPLVFENDAQKKEFFDLAQQALTVLSNPPGARSKGSK